MSFADPLWLVALILVPLAIVASFLARHRRRRYAVRYPALATLALAGAGRSSWRRYVPAVLGLAALAALIFALARPHVSDRVPAGLASVMLVSDESGSMASTDVAPTRLGAAEHAANTFIGELPDTVRVGAVAFSTTVNADTAPQTDHGAARNVIDGQQANGGTATGPALALALQLLDGAHAGHPPAAIVLLSDGAANEGIPVLTVARVAAREHIPIDTVALGTPGGTVADPEELGLSVSVPPDPELMAQIARLSGGRVFDARSADELSSIYTSLGLKLGTVLHRREITFEFAVAGLALLLIALLTSTRWSFRLP